MFEDLLVTKKENISTAMSYVCREKLKNDSEKTITTAKQIENGYQLFRKRHPEFPEHSFRTWVILCSPRLAEVLGW